MVDKKTKDKFIKELEKTGNVFLSCHKVGIDRSTYYRWIERSKEFKEKANEMICRGRENMADVGEHALMHKVKGGDISAIKYLLSHNSKRYRAQPRNVFIEHSRQGEKIEEFKKEKIKHWDEITEAHRGIIELIRSLEKDEADDVKKKFNQIQDDINLPDI